jgi:Ser/Thr protein kinase RdoA (MazF antagonist)
LTDAAVVGRILREYHQAGIGPTAIRRLTGSVRGASVTYRLGGPGGSGLVVRAFRTDLPQAVRFRGGGTAAVTDWLWGRAATLDWLEERAYPAPRVIRTHSGDLVGLAGVWATLATTYVAGAPLRPDTDQLRLLGEALGRLHALDAGTFADGTLAAGTGAAGRGAAGTGAAGTGAEGTGAARRALWHPETAIPAALGRLEAVESLIPADQRPLLESFRAVLLAVRQRARTLPTAVVHGDPWPGNAIRTAPDQVILIDWENAGLGMPLLDLGCCLLECHLDVGLPGDQPVAWHIQPDEDRIAAVVAGYARWRQLQPAEQDLLLEGIRFAAAFVGAIHLEQALIGGLRGEPMDARLERLRNRLAVSDAVAELARRQFDRARTRYAKRGRRDGADAGA